MGNNNSASAEPMRSGGCAASAFVLWLVAAFFLFLATVPVLAFAFYLKILPLPKLDYGSVAAVATIGLLAAPVILLLIAVVALVSSKKREFVPKPEHYPWEGVFKQRQLTAAAPPFAKPKDDKGVKVIAVVAVVVLAIAVLAFFTPKFKDFAIGTGANETAGEAMNVSAIATANVSETASAEPMRSGGFAASEIIVVNVSKTNDSLGFIQAFFRKVFAARNETKNETKKAAPVAAAEKTRQADFGKAIANVRSSIGKSVADIKSRIGKVPGRVWQSVAAAVLAVVLATTVFLSHRTGQLYEIVLWFKGWVAWLYSLPSAIMGTVMRNKLKSLAIVLAIAVVCAGVAAFVFRNKLANVGPAIFGLLVSLRSFLFVYRLYIFIGVFVLLVVIGILYMFERKGRK